MSDQHPTPELTIDEVAERLHVAQHQPFGCPYSDEQRDRCTKYQAALRAVTPPADGGLG